MTTFNTTSAHGYTNGTSDLDTTLRVGSPLRLPAAVTRDTNAPVHCS